MSDRNSRRYKEKGGGQGTTFASRTSLTSRHRQTRAAYRLGFRQSSGSCRDARCTYAHHGLVISRQGLHRRSINGILFLISPHSLFPMPYFLSPFLTQHAHTHHKFYTYCLSISHAYFSFQNISPASTTRRSAPPMPKSG